MIRQLDEGFSQGFPILIAHSNLFWRKLRTAVTWFFLFTPSLTRAQFQAAVAAGRAPRTIAVQFWSPRHPLVIGKGELTLALALLRQRRGLLFSKHLSPNA